MKHRSLEKLFARYLKRGDVRALGEVFDRSAPELLVIAGHLARDVAAAEDLVQTTFVVAIERGATFDVRRPLMPWLVGIMTHHSRYQRRRASRVMPPDRVGAPRALDPVAASEAREFGSALSSALSELPNTYRDVLFAHLAGGMKPREIARDLGRAPGTVRVQIHRGLDLLRKALPAGFALGTLAAVPPTRALAAMRAEVLGAGAKAISAGTACAVGSSVGALPASAMVKVSAYAGVLLVLSVGTGWFLSGANDPWSPPRNEVALVAPPVAEAQLALADAADKAPSRVSAKAIEAEVERPPEVELPTFRESAQQYVVRVDVESVSPCAGARVLVELESAPGVSATAKVGPRGVAEVNVTSLITGASTAKSPIVVTVDHRDHLVERRVVKPRFKKRSSSGSRFSEVKVALRSPKAILSGTLYAEGSASVALFELGEKGIPELQPIDLVELERGGTFSLRAADTGQYLIVAVAHGHAIETRSVDVTEAGRTIDVGAMILAPGESLTGEVQFPSGHSAEGSRVTAAYRERSLTLLAWKDLGWTGSKLIRAREAWHVRAGGRFEISGLAPGVYSLDVISPRGYPSGETRERSEYRASTPGITLLAKVALVRLSVSGAGAPLQGALIRPASSPPASRAPRTTDSEGTAEVFVPSLTSSKYIVARAGFRTAVVLIPPALPGRTLSQDVVLEPLAPGTTDLVIEARGMVELPSSLLVQRLVSGVREGLWIAHADGNTFRVNGLPSGASTLLISDGDPRSFLLEATLQVDLREGETATRDCEFREGGRIAIEFAEPAHGAEIELEGDEIALSAEVTSSGGSATFRAVPPGEYELRITARGFEDWRIPLIVTPARALVLHPRLQPDRKRARKSVSAAH